MVPAHPYRQERSLPGCRFDGGFLSLHPRFKSSAFAALWLSRGLCAALSIKPTAGLVILSAWAFLLLRRKIGKGFHIEEPAPASVPHRRGLWIIRNLLTQGALFSQEVMNLSKWSIAENLLNPFFYNNIPPQLFIALSILIVSAFLSIRGITRRW